MDNYWQRQQQDIEQLTTYTITNLEQKHKELALIRQQGYALDNQENDQIGERVLLKKLQQTAQAISRELGA